MPRSSSAANPQEDVFLRMVFQSHLGQPSVDTAIGSFPAGFEEPIIKLDIAQVVVRNRSRRVIFRSYWMPRSFVPFSQRILRKTSGFDIFWTAASVSRAMHFPCRRGEGFVVPPPRPSEHEQSQPNMSLS